LCVDYVVINLLRGDNDPNVVVVMIQIGTESKI